MRIRLSLVAPLLLVLASGCGTGHSIEETGEPSLHSEAPPLKAGPGREVRIKVVDYKFVPSQILATPGEKLRLVVQNTGHEVHSITFDMPAGAVSLPSHLRGGEGLQYEIQMPNEPGKFLFHCPVGDHYSRGMLGTIVAQ